MKKVKTQHSNLISRFYGQNKKVTVGLNLFNNFITNEKKKTENNQPRIKAANQDKNEEVSKNYGNAKVEKMNKNNEINRKTPVTIILVNVNHMSKNLCYKMESKIIKMMEVVTQYYNSIFRYFRQNKHVIIKVNSSNNFIVKKEKRRQSNKSRIET